MQRSKNRKKTGVPMEPETADHEAMGTKQKLGERSAREKKKIKPKKPRPPPTSLNVRSKHPKREHIKKKIPSISVQKRKSKNFPHQKFFKNNRRRKPQII